MVPTLEISSSSKDSKLRSKMKASNSSHNRSLSQVRLSPLVVVCSLRLRDQAAFRALTRLSKTLEAIIWGLVATTSDKVAVPLRITTRALVSKSASILNRLIKVFNNSKCLRHNNK
jgi:hypothetical protein